MMSEPPRVQKVSSASAEADSYFAFNNGHVFLKNGGIIKKYKLEGVFLHKLWEKQLDVDCKSSHDPPWHENAHCVLHDDRIVVRSGDTTTIYANDMKRRNVQFQGDFGRLCGAMMDTLVYCKIENGEDNYKIHLYSVKQSWSLFGITTSHAFTNTLPMTYTSQAVSTCYHPSSGQFAIIDQQNQTLDIYASTARHFRHVKLRYQPWWPFAMTAVGDFLVVGCWDSLYVHGWDGTQLGTLPREGLGLEHRLVNGLGCTADDLLVLAAIGDKEHVVTVNLYAVW